MPPRVTVCEDIPKSGNQKKWENVEKICPALAMLNTSHPQEERTMPFTAMD